jgi:hypothetical protein
VGQNKHIIIILLFLVSIIASLSLFAKQLSGRDVVVFKQAMEAIDKNNWVLAESLLNGLYNQFPNNSVIANNLAVASFNQGKLEKSQSLFASIIEQNKLTATAYRNLKKLYSYSAAKTYSTGLKLLKPIELPQLSILDKETIINRNSIYQDDSFQEPIKVLAANTEADARIGFNPPSNTINPKKTKPLAATVKRAETKKNSGRDKSKEIATDKKLNVNWFAQQNQLNNIPIKSKKEHTKAKIKVQAELLSRLEQWRNAWSVGNTDEYISMYKQDYSPAWENRNKWLKERKRKINKNNQVLVEIEKPRIFIHKLTFQPFVLFKEKVSSKKYSKLILKHLYWIKEGDEWVIEKETTIKKL